jgi:SAM-dependent methyltransferase
VRVKLRPPEHSLNERHLDLFSAIGRWWRQERHNLSALVAGKKLIEIYAEFLRESLPDRKRARYGDVDYDWEYRVDTTSANLGWRARLIGLLNSPYQPVEPELFREVINRLAIDFTQFTFIDIGSGKGRALLLASEFAFLRIIGIELLPELNRIAEANIRKFADRYTRCGSIEAIHGDAMEFPFPEVPLVVFVNNPLPEFGLRKLISNLENSLSVTPRSVFVIYANPLLEQVFLSDTRLFRKIFGTYQYAVFQGGT